MLFCRYIIVWVSLFTGSTVCAQNASVFKKIPLDSFGVKVYQVYPTIEGSTIMITSGGLWILKGRELTSPPTMIWYDTINNPTFSKIRRRSFDSEDSIRCLVQGKDSLLYYVSYDNRFLFRINGLATGFGWAPFNFPKTSNVCRLWIDNDNNLYAGTISDNFFVINGAAQKKSLWGIQYSGDKDSNCVVVKGALPVKHIRFLPGTGVFSFAQDARDNNMLWIGTSKGLYHYNKTNSVCIPAIKNENSYTVTEINTLEDGKVWFSTLEKGMGAFDIISGRVHFFPYPKTKSTNAGFPIKTFAPKSADQFFLAVMDSFPAIFNTQSGKYIFFSDSIMPFHPNTTEDISVDHLGNLQVVRNKILYVSDVSNSDLLKTSVIKDSSLMAPFFTSISLFSGEQLAGIHNNPESLREIELKHNQNTILVQFGINDFVEPKNVTYAYMVQGNNNEWAEVRSFNSDMNVLSIKDLRPGKYTLLLKVRINNEPWRKQMAKIDITVLPVFWQSWWFWTMLVAISAILIYFFLQWRINSVRKSERKKIQHEKDLLELEAKALRAQMNPHFIYNCLNSMKALIQTDDKVKAINYLTTFSKLIRSLFQNSDKRQISLYDELETCQMYTKLEAMRLGEKLKYSFRIDPNVDLKSLMVPALIIQPFIENAIWHGIVPKNGGEVKVRVSGTDETIVCIVEDDGIGRKQSKLNAPDPSLNHESRGVYLSQKRLDIQKILTEISATIDTVDKYDEHGENNSLGTKVTITFNLQ